jgi:uncharacterized protein (TIGR02594 family)
MVSAVVVSLAIFAGAEAVPRPAGPHHPAPKQFDDAAFQREFDRVMAKTGMSDPPPLVVSAVLPATTAAAAAPAHARVEPAIEPGTPAHAEAAAKTEAPARTETRAEVKRPADNSVETHAKTRPHRAGQRVARPAHRQPAAHRPDGLDAMAAVSGNELIAEARKYLGRNPTGWSRQWCGRFLDMVLRKTGHKGGGNLARGYLKYGKRLPGPRVGAIAVFSRRGGGHVGIVTGVDSNGNPIVISGNYSDRVAIATFPASRVLGYVDPD